MCDDLCATPLRSASFHRVISLAGVHHLADQTAFYREVFRLLKPGGIFALADVTDGSRVARFLNGFVDAHSSLGHKGMFLKASTGAELEAAGFEVIAQQSIAYGWIFDSSEDMGVFCQRLFGVDRASRDEVLQGIARSVGYRSTQTGCLMDWELDFFTVRKGE